MLTKVSIGRLFAGGIIPGLILSALYVSYIGIRSFFQPHLGPVLPPEERAPLRRKIVLSRGLILPIILIVAVLGCITEEVTMLCLTIPIYAPILSAYAPILSALGFDPVWFGILFMVNMQMAYLTPPFGFTLFFMKGVAPPGVTMGDIYRSIIPFIPLQWIGLLLVLFFPQLALWLPEVVFGLM